jgi:hypothetical protein
MQDLKGLISTEGQFRKRDQSPIRIVGIDRTAPGFPRDAPLDVVSQLPKRISIIQAFAVFPHGNPSVLSISSNPFNDLGSST